MYKILSKKSVRCRSLIVLFFVFFNNAGFAQKEEGKTWHLQKPGGEFYGVNATSASCPSPRAKVIVAVLDAGTDVQHPDLKDNIWINEDEVPGNGIDDDNNGYIDDINGWNFLGGKNGNVDYETIELTRLYRLPKTMMPQGVKYKTIKKNFKKEKKRAEKNARWLIGVRNDFDGMVKKLGSDTPSVEQVKAYEMPGLISKSVKNALVYSMTNGVSYHSFMKSIYAAADEMDSQLKYHLNPEYNPRSIVGDDVNNLNERNYGNNDVKGGVSLHGTHVAGIIGAVRNNNLGGDGVTSSVRLMILRIVPSGDERDKDVANAIRYAADNGAKVINMSFGKDYSPNRDVVEAAIQYASAKDVLFIHGAGNEGRNNDIYENYPTAFLRTVNLKESNWIEVGSSNNDGSASSFSNYGLKSVDVFAPGMNIYSTLPDSAYGFESGTSMASPVVAGVACMIRSCYPELNAVQVKMAILKSVEKNNDMTTLPGSRKTMVPFSSLSVTGGIVNAQKAMEIASGMANRKSN
jgi:subtilisin family serine protease